MEAANALAYCDTETVMDVKFFIVLAERVSNKPWM
jgi:hypothetical protein